MRLDSAMYAKNIVQSRSTANQLIKDGAIFLNGKQTTKPATQVSENDEIIVKKELFVGRGAYKLLSALNHFQIEIKNKKIADIGASTGGFTEVLLRKKAAKIYAIDIGFNQLSSKLIKEPKVINLEKTDIRKMNRLPEKLDFCICDLSFISLTKVLPAIFQLTKKDSFVLALFKPQFESGPKAVTKSGILPKNLIKKSITNFQSWATENHFSLSEFFPCEITGKQGNQEFWVSIKSFPFS
jgi:23S rRNA (cytidine1920-2'-O)/16S rRNA (cytidine1409-2'-O)-methyltransferase